MTIGAGHGMDVIGTGPVKIGGVHGHYIQTAAGHRRVTGLTGISGIIGVPPVTGPAADSLMDANRRSVVFASGLVGPVGSMALDADGL